MRILHVVPTYLPAVRYGGPIWSVHSLCKALVGLGHDVTVATTNVNGETHSDVPLDRPVLIDGVHVLYFSSVYGRRFYYAPGMKNFFQEHMQYYDIVHIHSMFLWPTLCAANFANKFRIPFVLAPRGMLVRALFRKRGWLRKTLWLKLFDRKNIAAAAAVHVTSQQEITDISAFKLPIKRYMLIPNGISRSDCVDIPEIRSPGDSILFLGRISWKKGIDRLIRAMLDIPEAKLVIAGNDDENLRPGLENLVKNLNLQARISFTGPVDSFERNKLYRAADIFVLPSHSENFGNTVIESMANGCPVVVTPEVGMATIIQQNDAGRVARSDCSDLAGIINMLLENPDERERLASNALKFVTRQMTWETQAKQAVGFYEQLAHSGNMDSAI